MAWWWWVLLWVVLVVGAGTIFVFIGLSLWRTMKELSRELAAAAERFALISEQLERLSPPPAEPAVFDDLSQLRARQQKALRLARARTDLRMRQRAGLRPQFPAKAQGPAPAPVGEQSVR